MLPYLDQNSKILPGQNGQTRKETRENLQLVAWELDYRSKMANPSDSWSLQETDEKPPVDREYLNEWPPVGEQSEYGKCRERKIPRIDRKERVGEIGVSGFSDAAEGELSVLWARPALARWWRRRQQERDLTDSKRMPKSDNPNTILRYVAR